jgi:hypothetical protein
MVKKKKTNKKIIKKKRTYKKHRGGSKQYSDYNIIFTNEYQNGDIYISSQFIIDIKNKINKDIKYYIKLSGNYSINPANFEYMNIPLLDINTHTQYKKGEFITINHETKEIIINTWCGIFKKFNGLIDDVNLALYYEQFTELYKLLELNIEPIDFYIPSFNQPYFTKYNDNLEIIKNIYRNINKKKVLICNGNAYSHVSIIDPKIIKFFIDNNYFVKVTNENTINDPTILEMYKNNLEEYSNISYHYNDIMKKDNLLYINNIFATQSDIIVGLASGLFITTYSKETLDKKFIMISNDNHILYEKFNSSWIKNDNIDAIIKGIETFIKG